MKPLKDACSHSTISNSLDGRRVAHVIGWRCDGQLMKDVDLRYDAFRDRAGGKDGPGTAVALIECTHLYESIFAVHIQYIFYIICV